MNRLTILLLLSSLFLFSATFPTTFYPNKSLVSEFISESTSENNNIESSKNISIHNSEKEEGKDSKEQAKKKTKRKPFQTLRKLNQLRKAFKQSKKSYKENFPKIAKNKKDDGDCDVPANKLDWRVWVALGCVILMLVLPLLTAFASVFFINAATTSFVALETLAAIAGFFSPLLGLIGFFTGLAQLKKYSYKKDCENYVANRKNRTVAMIATIVGGLIPLALLLFIILLILSLGFAF